MRVARSSIPLLALLVVASAVVPGPAVAPSNPVGTITVRVTIDDFVSPGDVPDWILDGQMDALNETCFANARTGHSRYVAPQGLDFHLRFDGSAAAADCLGATYTIRLVGNDHVDDSLLDLDGTHPGGGVTLCPTTPGPAREAAAWCTGTIAFTLNGGTVSGTLDGAADGGAGEDDARLDYTVRVVASDIAEVPAPAWSPWLVRLHIDDLKLLFLEDPYAGDWIFDGEAANATGGCKGEARTLHSRFAPPTQLDLVIRDGAACGGQTLRLRYLVYMHANDGPVDINGNAGGPNCPIGPSTPDGARTCELAFDFALAEGVGATRYANGSEDGNPGENDGNLTYRMEARYQFARSTAHLAFTLTPPVGVDDWLMDGSAAGGSGCAAQARTSHTRFQDQRMLDLEFRGPGAVACLQNAIDVTLIAYAHASDSLFDLSDTTAAQGGEACPSHPTPTAAEAGGCLLAIAWTDPSQAKRVVSDANDDGFATDLDAVIDVTLRRYA